MDCYYVAIDVDSDDVICCASNMTDMMEWLLTIFEDAVYIDFCYNCHSKSADKKYVNGFWNIALIRRSTKTTRML